MDAIVNVVVSISNWLWGLPILLSLAFMAIFMTIRLKGIQFKHLGYALSSTLGVAFRRDKDKLEKGEGTVNAFAAMSSALACAVGAGNIAGVAIAIVTGGPGAVFWMWVIAFLAMALKYSEVALAIKYRRQNDKGEWEGGPIHYMERGMNAKWLAVIFAVCLSIEVLISSMTQANQMANSIYAATGIPTIATGLVTMVLTALVLLGGIKTLASFAEKMVPIMAAIYLIGGLIVLFGNIGQILPAFGLIFKCAFTGHAAVGGFAGSGVALAVRMGMARGLYSNEAGLGTAPIAHSSADTDHPARQGMWGIVEVFLDTIVICTMTALVVICTGTWSDAAVSGMAGADITTMAFASFFGKAGGWIVALCMVMFVFSTLCVLIWYGQKQMEYLTKSEKVGFVYRIFCCLLIPVGAIGSGVLFWNFLDLALAMILFPNLIALLVLNKEVVALTKEFFGTKDQYYLADMAAKAQRKATKKA